MRRTLDNLEYIEADVVAQRREEIFEITQLVNSFLGVLAHPWEKLFDAGSLATLEIGSEEYDGLGFPTLPSTWSQDTEHPKNLAHLLRLLRNGVAHGNIDLLSKEQLRCKYGKEPEKLVREDEIGGAEIWNNKDETDSKAWTQPVGRRYYKSPYRTWGTVLTIDEMRACLDALIRLSKKREYLRTTELMRDGGRRTRMQAKTDIRKQIQRDRP